VACQRCSSRETKKFKTEVNFHFPGWEGLTRPTVLAFPEVTVCLNCGFATFDISDSELQRLAEGAATGHVEPSS
jgi:hypothetical protein